MSEEVYRTLDELRDEAGIAGKAVEKDLYLGDPLLIRDIALSTEESNIGCFVSANVIESGELIGFSLGKDQARKLAQFVDRVPFKANLFKGKSSSGNTFYGLE